MRLQISIFTGIFFLFSLINVVNAQSTTQESKTLILPLVGRTAGVGIYYGPILLYQSAGGTSVIGGKVLGRVDAEAGMVTGIPVISDTLNFGFGIVNLNKLFFDTSYTRGMKEDERVTQISNGQGTGAFLNWNFLDQRVQFSNTYAIWNMKFDRYLNTNEEEIELPGIHLGDLKTTFIINSLTIDLTDNIKNPISGGKFGLTYNSARTSTEYSGTDTISYFANGYIPIGEHSTWVFRGFGSDATVKKQATTDENRIRELLDINCSEINDSDKRKECSELEEGIIQSLKKHNELGTATPLGGSRMLRSYREARFRGRHSRFIGTEFRFNIPEVFSNTQLQMAVFAESGSAADERKNIWKTVRSSYGIALRLAIEKLVIRIEAASGEENQEWHLTVGDPW